MRNELPKRFADNIIERPEYIGSRVNSQKYDDLATTLKIMEPTKSIILDEKETICLFGKNWRTSVAQNLKKRGTEKPRFALKDGKCYFWSTKV